MGLQTEIKVSQISALLHNVPDTPFCKQFFFFSFFWLKEHVNVPSEMDGLSLFPSHLLLFTSVTKDIASQSFPGLAKLGLSFAHTGKKNTPETAESHPTGTPRTSTSLGI